MCIQDKEELYGALKQETVILRCRVDANPSVVAFHWTFNNSGDLTEVPASRFSNEMSTSHLNYTPMSDMEYGTLSCWGENEVGYQKSPCVFQIVAAGRYLYFNYTIISSLKVVHQQCDHLKRALE